MYKTLRLTILATLLIVSTSSSVRANEQPTSPPAVVVPSQAPRRLAATSAEIKTARTLALARLATYRKRGEFAANAKGYPMSVFRDAEGRHCPMAELIFQSGHADLVDEVVKTNNGLRLADVHDGPLATWMATSGLTRAEIIEIQGLARLPIIMKIDDPTEAHQMMARRLLRVERKLRAQTKASLKSIALQLAAPQHSRDWPH